MDRRVKIEITDEFLTAAANDNNADTEIALGYRRGYHPEAVSNGASEWQDCTEVLIEGLAITLRDSLVDSTLCDHAADMLADRLRARVKELREDFPEMDSSSHAHIRGALNIH